MPMHSVAVPCPFSQQNSPLATRTLWSPLLPTRLPGPRRRSLSRCKSGEDFAASGGIERNACRSPHPVADGIDSTTAHRHCRGSMVPLPSLHHAPHRHFSRRRPPRDSRPQPLPRRASASQDEQRLASWPMLSLSRARASPQGHLQGRPPLLCLHPLARCASNSTRRGTGIAGPWSQRRLGLASPWRWAERPLTPLSQPEHAAAHPQRLTCVVSTCIRPFLPALPPKKE